MKPLCVFMSPQVHTEVAWPAGKVSPLWGPGAVLVAVLKVGGQDGPREFVRVPWLLVRKRPARAGPASEEMAAGVSCRVSAAQPSSVGRSVPLARGGVSCRVRPRKISAQSQGFLSLWPPVASRLVTYMVCARGIGCWELCPLQWLVGAVHLWLLKSDLFPLPSDRL